jgi:serine O-acetyltransferase
MLDPDPARRGAAAPTERWATGARDGVLSALRAARHAGGLSRAGASLPSRAELRRIVNGLLSVLFPAHFGPPDLPAERIDGFVAGVLDAVLPSLREQILRELALFGAAVADDRDAEARAIATGMAQALPEVRAALDKDVQAAFDGDPAALSLDEVLLCYPGIKAIAHHRIAHVLHQLGAPLLARTIAELAHSETGIDIHPGAKIGPSFFIDHGTGVVIGATTVIGERVRLYQAVTLGAKSFPTDESGHPLKGVPRHPIVEDDVVIYAGATILGRITIGRGSTIGGNVWLTRSVPPGSTISQAQVRHEAFEGGAGI